MKNYKTFICAKCGEELPNEKVYNYKKYLPSRKITEGEVCNDCICWLTNPE